MDRGLFVEMKRFEPCRVRWRNGGVFVGIEPDSSAQGKLVPSMVIKDTGIGAGGVPVTQV